ncbi:MAG TPA: hypothetical protein VMA83_05395 [Solirubrobacteraceae bacterium]|nr:hypothetical protein [Solirubrobacteraceae bacterium]
MSDGTPLSALAGLRALLADEGPLVAGALAPVAAANGGSPAAVAARGPRAAHASGEYELAVEAIYEGYLLHGSAARLFAAGDEDLAVLLGDHLYALGLARLVELGDIAAVVELADTISLAAQARSGGDRELADAAWLAGASAVGWGPSAAHAEAKRLARSGAPEALAAMLTSARTPSDAD